MTRSVPSRERRRDGLGAIDTVTISTLPGTMRQEVLNADAGGQNGFTQVQRFEVAGLTLPPNGITMVRFTFQAGAAEGLIITNAYVGHAAAAGDAYDFDTTPTQITFGGLAFATIAAGGVVVSDWIYFAYNKTSALLVAYYIGGGTSDDTIRYKTGLANVNHYSKAANDAATVNKTGYATNAGYVVGVQKVESDGF